MGSKRKGLLYAEHIIHTRASEGVGLEHEEADIYVVDYCRSELSHFFSQQLPAQRTNTAQRAKVRKVTGITLLNRFVIRSQF